jgi:hypothetical protein
MSVERYAAFEQATRVSVVRIGNLWWQESRPFFYRPLLPFKKYDSTAVRKQFNRIGIFQHAVEDGQSSNSYLNPCLFEKPRDYDVRRLHDNARRSLKKALRSPITVRRVLDEGEFSENGYPAYLSFYQRTKYGFDTGRREKSNFAQWSHSIFRFPEAVILGAFVGEELVSFEISCLVENTLILKTRVTSDKALKLNASDLLLHYFRSAAQDQVDIHRIYDSMMSENSGLNKYKMMRGATVIALPAFLHIHPGILWLIKKANCDAHERLRGLNNEQLMAEGLVRH